MHIRHYKIQDAEAIAQLFLSTVRTINARDYTAEQLAAWTAGNTEPSVWHAKLTSAKIALVAEMDGSIVGFADLTHEGVLDHLFVHKDFQRRGVGRALCQAIKEAFDGEMLQTFASITAKPFFESMGFVVLKEQTVKRNSEELINYLMVKMAKK